MLPESNLARPRTNDEKVTLGSRKNAQTKAPGDQAMKCPRCDSPNTKFCYYNNYSLSQPRHFCKTCRRYWTKGGALRNVPVGGGCRKNKKVKSSFRLPAGVGSKDSGSSHSEIGRLGFLDGLPPVIDFQLGGSSPFSQVHNASSTGFYDQFGVFSLDQTRISNSFTASVQSPLPQAGYNGLNVDTSLASSIESLSSINQDLHWKLQQQRLAMLLGGDNAAHKDSGISSPIAPEDHNHKLYPASFQNLEISKPEDYNSSDIITARKDIGAGGDSEWFFGSSYAATSVTTTTPNTMTGTSPATYNSGDSAAGCNGVRDWDDFHQYSHLP